jgi:hypothetical protein
VGADYLDLSNKLSCIGQEVKPLDLRGYQRVSRVRSQSAPGVPKCPAPANAREQHEALAPASLLCVLGSARTCLIVHLSGMLPAATWRMAVRLAKRWKTCGCAILMEPDSCWPVRAFASDPDRDPVVVVYLGRNDESRRLARRIRACCAEFERDNIRLRSVIIACSGTDRRCYEQRAKLVRALLPLLDPGSGRIALECAPGTGRTTHDLITSVDAAFDELGGRTMAFFADDERVTERAHIKRQDSGVYTIDPETLRGIDPHYLLGWSEPTSPVGEIQ